MALIVNGQFSSTPAPPKATWSFQAQSDLGTNPQTVFVSLPQPLGHINNNSLLHVMEESLWVSQEIFGGLRTARLGQGTTATSWNRQEEVEAPVSGSKRSWGEITECRLAICVGNGSEPAD